MRTLNYGSNVSYNDKTLYIIDVSQSVEHDHPRSLEFLRMDIKNVTEFFRKKGVPTMHERTAFDFITTEFEPIDRNEMIAEIDALVSKDQNTLADVEVNERVFRQAYIPKSLFEVVDPERDTGILQQGGKADLIYSKFLDVQETKPEVKPTAEGENRSIENGAKQDTAESLGEDEDSDSESDRSEASSDESTGKPRGHKHEDKAAKKVWFLVTSILIPRNGSKKSRKRHGSGGRRRCPNRKRRGRSGPQGGLENKLT